MRSLPFNPIVRIAIWTLIPIVVFGVNWYFPHERWGWFLFGLSPIEMMRCFGVWVVIYISGNYLCHELIGLTVRAVAKRRKNNTE